MQMYYYCSGRLGMFAMRNTHCIVQYNAAVFYIYIAINFFNLR